MALRRRPKSFQDDRQQPESFSRDLSSLHDVVLPSQAGSLPDRMTIRLADCDGERNRANMLLERMYSWRGYGRTNRVAAEPNSVTFTATAGGDLIGTLTLTFDSDEGLATDSTFKDELDRFRAGPGVRLCELTNFAFDSSTPSQPRLAALFHIIFIYGSMHYDCTDLLIEVNPRHVRFYEAMLGFTRVGDVRTNEKVNAPSQLMWLNVAEIQQQIQKHADAAQPGNRSLYRHFFSRKEEEGIYQRLCGLSAQSNAFQSTRNQHIVTFAHRPKTKRQII